MTKTLACVLSTCVVLAGGAVIRAGSAQDRASQPGQPTQGKVWIQNQGETEAVPVRIQTMASEAPPLRVQIIGSPTALAPAARQLWEYQAVTISTGQNPVTALNTAGMEGWEATGVALPVQGGTLVVMKRPR
jgi:hypothetical protein